MKLMLRCAGFMGVLAACSPSSKRPADTSSSGDVNDTTMSSSASDAASEGVSDAGGTTAVDGTTTAVASSETSGSTDASTTNAGSTTDESTTADETEAVSGSSASETSSDTSDELVPEAPTLQLGFSAIKQFDFSWSVASDADFYQLLERAQPDDQFALLADNIVGEEVSFTMPLHLRWNASYILRACNNNGCTDSAQVDVMDSLASAVGYFKASSPGEWEFFGEAVALSADGSTLAVGTPNEKGVYVFVHESGLWSQEAYVEASNASAAGFFGAAIALSADGSTLAVGAPYEGSGSTGINGNQNNNSEPSAGAAYVFVREDSVWSQQAYIKAAEVTQYDYFGRAVALSADGNTLAVGMDGADSPSIDLEWTEQQPYYSVDSGAVYVFAREASTWSQEAYLEASHVELGDHFGQAIALSGDGNTLAVGTYYEDSAAIGIDGDQDDNSAPHAGAAYVFARENGVWIQEAYIKASNTDANDYFGAGLGLSNDGNTLVVSAWQEDSAATGINGDPFDNSLVNAGAVYVFAREASTWSQEAYIKASNANLADLFGGAIALSGDGTTLAVGAIREDAAVIGINGDQSSNNLIESGAAYVFMRKNGEWSQGAYIKAPNTDENDFFGGTIALSGDGKTLAIGATWESSSAMGINGDQSNNATAYAGAVYLY